MLRPTHLLLTALLARGDSLRVEAILEICPNPSPDEVIQLAMIWSNRGEVDRAIRHYEKGLGAFTRDANFKNSYAWFLQENGRKLDSALEAANAALDRSPDDLFFRDTRAMVQLRRGQPAEAL